MKLKYIYWFLRFIFKTLSDFLTKPVHFFNERIWLENLLDFLVMIDLDNDVTFNKIIEETIKNEKNK